MNKLKVASSWKYDDNWKVCKKAVVLVLHQDNNLGFVDILGKKTYASHFCSGGKMHSYNLVL